MRRAIATADVGDEQRLADPDDAPARRSAWPSCSARRPALFLPSGTMCNQIAFRLHARPGGDELILDRTAHPIIAEAGGPAQNSQLMIHALDGDGGIFTGDQVRGGDPRPVEPLPAALARGLGGADDEHGRRARLAARAGPRGARGGAATRAARPHGRRAADERRGRVRHVRGASTRAASTRPGSTSPRASARRWAPCSCGSRELIDEAWRWKQQMGGAFRQSGHRRGRLPLRARPQRRAAGRGPRQRARARRGAAELGCDVIAPETNIVIFSAPDGLRRADGRARRRAERHAGRPRAGRDAPRRGPRRRSTRRCWRPGTHCYPDAPWQRSVTRAERAPRSGTAAATRWWRPSAASTRTCRRSASTSGALPGASTSARAASRPARSRRPSSPAGRPWCKKVPVHRREPGPLPAGRGGRARGAGEPPAGGQRPERLPGRRRRHGRQHGAHHARGGRRARRAERLGARRRSAATRSSAPSPAPRCSARAATAA